MIGDPVLVPDGPLPVVAGTFGPINFASGAVYDHDPADVGQPAGHAGKAWQVIAVDDEHLRLCVVDHRFHFLRREPPVDGDVHDPAERSAEEGLEVVRTVAVQERDAAPRAHPV